MIVREMWDVEDVSRVDFEGGVWCVDFLILRGTRDCPSLDHNIDNKTFDQQAASSKR